MQPNKHLLTVPPNIGGKPVEDVEAELGISEMVRLGSNENSFGPSPLALAAFQDALTDAHRYPGVAERELRQKLAALHNARDGAAFDAANLMTGNGLSDVIRMIAHAYLCGEGQAIYCNPTFPLYGIFARMYGATTVAVPHANFEYNLDAMADAITPDTRVIYVCNPNNPTGTLVSRERVDRFMQRVPPTVMVAFDEAYYELVEDRAYSNSVEYVKAGYENVIVLRGFSKVYGLANLRVGYAIAAKPTIEYLSRAQIVYNSSDAAMRAASAALDDVQHVEKTRSLLARERTFLYKGFAALGLSYIPSYTNFILLVNLPYEAKAIDQELLRRGVLVRPMGGFGMPDALRVTIGTHEENERLLGGLAQTLQLKAGTVAG